MLKQGDQNLDRRVGLEATDRNHRLTGNPKV
jgi:hypothetical protein